MTTDKDSQNNQSQNQSSTANPPEPPQTRVLLEGEQPKKK